MRPTSSTSTTIITLSSESIHITLGYYTTGLSNQSWIDHIILHFFDMFIGTYTGLLHPDLNHFQLCGWGW